VYQLPCLVAGGALLTGRLKYPNSVRYSGAVSPVGDRSHGAPAWLPVGPVRLCSEVNASSTPTRLYGAAFVLDGSNAARSLPTPTSPGVPRFAG
jgi:hypothetical protein